MAFPIPPLKFNLLVLSCVLTSVLLAQTASKTFDQTFANRAEINIKQSRGPLTILPAEDGKVRIVTSMSASGKTKANAEAFLEKAGTTVQEMTASLKVKIGIADVKTWSQNNNKLKVIFKDGTKFNSIYDFEINTTIYLPKVELLKIESRFERVDIDPKVAINNLRLSLHNSKFQGGEVAGNLELDMRFGEIELDNIGGRLSGSLHNVRGEFGDVKEVDLESRFSRLRMGMLGSLTIDSHNDQLEAKAVTGEVNIDDRFGTFVLGNTGKGRINTHNGSFEIKNAEAYRIDSRFGNFEFDQLNVLTLIDSHNSDFIVDKLGSVWGDGRFTTIKADELTGNADLDMHNGKLKINTLGSSFKGIEVEGAFYEVNVRQAPAVAYRILADLRFGNTDLPQDLIVVIKEKEMSNLKLELKTSNATSDSPVISVRGQNGTLRID